MVGIGRAGNVIGGGDWANRRIVPDCIKSWKDKEKVEIRNPFSTRPWQHVLEPLSGYLMLGQTLFEESSLSGQSFNIGPTEDCDFNVKEIINDLEENTEFRIKWPRGQLGSLPADSEQFMMIEDLYKSTDKLNKHIESMALNKVNIEFLRKQMDKVLEDIEKLKDANRSFTNNG